MLLPCSEPTGCESHWGWNLAEPGSADRAGRSAASVWVARGLGIAISVGYFCVKVLEVLVQNAGPVSFNSTRISS